MKNKEKPIDICKVHCKDFACRKYVAGEYCDMCKIADEDKENIEELKQQLICVCKDFIPFWNNLLTIVQNSNFNTVKDLTSAYIDYFREEVPNNCVRRFLELDAAMTDMEN